MRNFEAAADYVYILCSFAQHSLYVNLANLTLFFTGEWNNNPTALQFQSNFRRLMARCGARSGNTGNVLALDDFGHKTR
jgi:hypothetical protein